VTTLHAHVGDGLTLPPEPGHAIGRRGRVVALLHPDGLPPFRVRWLEDDRETHVVPPLDARVQCPERPRWAPGGA
jgi:hypothetical protein